MLGDLPPFRLPKVFAELFNGYLHYLFALLDIRGNGFVFCQGFVDPYKAPFDVPGCVFSGKTEIAPPAFFPCKDQPGFEQDGHVLRNRGRSQPQNFNDLAEAELSIAQEHQYADPVFIRERLGDLYEIAHLDLW